MVELCSECTLHFQFYFRVIIVRTFWLKDHPPHCTLAYDFYNPYYSLKRLHNVLNGRQLMETLIIAYVSLIFLNSTFSLLHNVHKCQQGNNKGEGFQTIFECTSCYSLLSIFDVDSVSIVFFVFWYSPAQICLLWKNHRPHEHLWSPRGCCNVNKLW